MGNGRIWIEPVKGNACVLGRDVVMKFGKFGLYHNEDVFIEIPSDSPIYTMSTFDRLTSLNRTEPFTLNRVAGVNIPKTFNVVSLEKVFWFDSDNNEVVGTLPVIQADGSLLWNGIVPPDGTTYSITGRKNAEFYAFESVPLDRSHFGGLDLPRRVVLRNFSQYEK